MSRKGRARKWKIPTSAASVRPKGGGVELTVTADAEESSGPDEMVQSSSSPLHSRPGATEPQPLLEGPVLNGTVAHTAPPSIMRDPTPAPAQADQVAKASAASQVRSRPPAPSLSFSSPPPAPASAPASESKETVKKDESSSGADHRRDDDASVPPVDLDSDFFALHHAASHEAFGEASFEIDTRDPRVAMKRTATAARRRAHLAKYVTGAVGLASTLCLAALFKVAIAPARGASRVQHSSYAAQAADLAAPPLNAAPTTESVPSPPAAANSVPADSAAPAEGTAQVVAQPPTPAPATSGDPSAPVPQVAAEHGAPGAAEPSAPSAQAANADPPETPSAKTDEVPLDPRAAAKEAAKEKAKARSSLEWGKFADSIAAGERSVAIDPTDAEAWLILGAAYQQKGDSKSAVRSFKACTDQGKRGPKYECAAMLRSR